MTPRSKKKFQVSLYIYTRRFFVLASPPELLDGFFFKTSKIGVILCEVMHANFFYDFVGNFLFLKFSSIFRHVFLEKYAL